MLKWEYKPLILKKNQQQNITINESLANTTAVRPYIVASQWTQAFI